jgi:hypothetical protein
VTADKASAIRKLAELGSSGRILESSTEPPSPLSPFDRSGSFRADESWKNKLSKRSSVVRKKRATEPWG